MRRASRTASPAATSDVGLADWLLLILALAVAGVIGFVLGFTRGVIKGWADAEELLSDDEPDPSDNAGA